MGMHVYQLLNSQTSSKDGDPMSGHDPEMQSVIRLSSEDMVLYLREVSKYLALVCILKQDKFDKHGSFASFTLPLMLRFD